MGDLKQRAFWTMIQNAILSPASALVIAAAILLVGLGVRVPLVDAPPVAWLVALTPLWLAVVGAGLANREANAQAASQVFREQFNLNALNDSHLRMMVGQAIAYRERIDSAMNKAADSALRLRLQDVADQVQEWVGRIYALARRLDAYRSDTFLANDRKTAEQSIRQLRDRLARENDPAIQAEIRDTIARRQAQMASLDKLSDTMDRAELQIENTLTALGTVYSQMLLIDARDVNSARTQRLRDSIVDQVNSLQDVLASIEEVYGDRQVATQSSAKS
jgi:hypothetical protein